MFKTQTNIGTEFNKNFGNAYLGTGQEAPTSIGNLLSRVLPQIYVIGLLLVLTYFIWGAYRYMLAGGDPKALAAAKSHLTWAVVGMIIIFLSFGIVQIINTLVGAGIIL